MPNPTVDNSNPAIIAALRGNYKMSKSSFPGKTAQDIQTDADTELESRLTPATTASVPIGTPVGVDFPIQNADVPTGE